MVMAGVAIGILLGVFLAGLFASFGTARDRRGASGDRCAPPYDWSKEPDL